MVIIIGSGAGGGILAMELAKANIPVTIIEKGPFINSNEAFNYYDKSDEGLDLLKTTCIGGSTMVSAGNAVRSLEEELFNLGIDLSEEFEYIENLINVHELDDSHFGKGTNLFLESSKKLGLNGTKMPKFIQESKCLQCGNCAFGCPTNAKWTSKDFIQVACENGAELLCNCECTELLVKNNLIIGVKILNNGKEEVLKSDTVILSAGAINSAILLRKIGLPAGEKLFTDPFVTVGGVLKNINFYKEVQMNALIKKEHFILSPHFSTFIPNKINKKDVENKDILSIMVKIPDEGKGHVLDDGTVVKINTIRDVQYLAEGSATAGAILKEAGVDPSTIVSTLFRSAHPGGTAAIGEVVNKNLETKIKGLYVSDASVLPTSPGVPPILTILALSKKLASYLIKDYSNCF